MGKKSDFDFTLHLDTKSRKILGLVKQWPKRAERLRKLVPYLAAKYVHEHILQNLPNKDDWSSYRSSLQVARVAGAPKGVSAYALRAATRTSRTKKAAVDLTILYVRPTSRLRRTRPEIEILRKFSPWTFQTLPFTPKRSEAILISRKVNKREVDKVTKARLKDRPLWHKALAKTGRRETRKDQRLDIPKKVHTLPDVAFEALRLEFGLGGVKGQPHWRPAIQALISSGLRSMFAHDPKIIKLFKDPKFRDWKRWPPRVRHTVRMAEVKNYVPFQKKLYIRAKI